MNIKFTGKIIDVLPLKSGTSARGNEWQCQNYVIEEVNQQYPSRCNFQVFGADKILEFNILEGEVLTVSLGINANKGKSGDWFNKLDCWKVERLDGNKPQNPIDKQLQDIANNTPASNAPASESDLPF